MIDEVQYRKIVGYFLKNKLLEHAYFLGKILRVCKVVSENYLRGINPVNDSGDDIGFTFNAYVSTFQTLKDSLQIATGVKVPWSRFKHVRHSGFMKECRNAITHDGMQIIDAYADGKYYMARSIERFDDRGHLKRINAPSEDVLTFCIQFSSDLMDEIASLVTAQGAFIPVQSSADRLAQIEEVFNMPFVPDFAKQMYNEKKDEIQEKLADISMDPVEEIRREIAAIQSVCKQHEVVKGTLLIC